MSTTRETRERQISMDEVNALSIGCRVNIHGEDADGNHRVLECTIAGCFDGKVLKHKFLIYRYHGQIRKCALREYPEKYYTKVW